MFQGNPELERSSTPESPNPWSTSATLVTSPVLVETDENHEATEEKSKVDIEEEEVSVMPEEPTSSESQNPWSTSATLPISSEPEVTHRSPEAGNSSKEGASSTPWSTSATLPVSPEPENNETPIKPTAASAAEAAPKEEKKKLSKAEYKVAFKHFLVRCNQFISDPC